MKHEDYTVEGICALPIEMAVAVGMLDERHENLLKKTGTGWTV